MRNLFKNLFMGISILEKKLRSERKYFIKIYSKQVGRGSEVNTDNSDNEEEESIIIDRDTAPSNNLVCGACGSSETRYTTKNNRKKIPVDVWLKKPGQNVALSLWWVLSHHHEPQTAERIRFFDVSNKEIRPKHLSEEMPGCIDPVGNRIINTHVFFMN